MAGTSKTRSEPRAFTRARRALREHRGRWHAAIDARGRLAAAVGWVRAAAANTHDADRTLLERAAVEIWEIGSRLNSARIDRAQRQPANTVGEEGDRRAR